MSAGVGLVLSQHPDDLFLAETTPLRCRLPVQSTDSISIWQVFGEQVMRSMPERILPLSRLFRSG